MAYRWEHTDAALSAQLELERDGRPGVVEPGHAAVRFSNPTSGADALPTMRTEMHRIAGGTSTVRTRTSASSVGQIFQGVGTVEVGDQTYAVAAGDVIAVPPWGGFAVSAEQTLDLFVFSDAPVFEKLNLLRTETVR
jgi:gentisate 1,2-dioxygenase